MKTRGTIGIILFPLKNMNKNKRDEIDWFTFRKETAVKLLTEAYVAKKAQHPSVISKIDSVDLTKEVCFLTDNLVYRLIGSTNEFNEKCEKAKSFHELAESESCKTSYVAIGNVAIDNLDKVAIDSLKYD